MKNKIFLTLIIAAIFSSGALYAEENYNLTDLSSAIIPYVQLDIMCSLDSFLDENESAQMKLYSEELAPFYKDILYKKYSQDPWGVSIVNFCTGGMGSLINGNILSGSILQAGFIASYTFMVLGMMEQDPTVKSTDFLIAEIGAAVFGLAGIAIPFIEISAYNKSLKQSLNL